MKRITKKAVTYGHTVYRYVGAHQQHPEGDAPGMISIGGIMDLLSRLARYEDTGLEPEEIAALREQEERRWIPVTERLPETDTCVLVRVSGNPRKNITLKDAYELAEYDPEGWILEMWPEWEDAEVTCWMPLPEPPKGGMTMTR